jgi:hypothetical protein
MKLGKILIVAMVFWVLLLGSTYSVTATDEQLTDPQGDVIVMDFMSEDYNYSTTDEKPNIDIKKLTYIYDNGATEASIALEVYGEIENRGSLNESSMDILNSVMYTIMLETSNEIYSITYANQQCKLTKSSSLDSINITDWSVNGGVLTIPITLSSSDGAYVNMNAETLDMNVDLSGNSGGMYIDMVPDEIVADADGPYDGEVGESIVFSGDAYDAFGTSISCTYDWNFGDGATSTKQNPTHSYDAVGNYTVTLTVEDSVGNTANDTIKVTISEEEGNGGNGNGGETGQDGADSGLILFFAVIAIIVVIGIVVLILIIRR